MYSNQRNTISFKWHFVEIKVVSYLAYKITILRVNIHSFVILTTLLDQSSFSFYNQVPMRSDCIRPQFDIVYGLL